MKKVRIKSESKHYNETFLHVAKTTGFFQEGLVYTFVEFPNDTLLRQALCSSVRTIPRNELTSEIAFLDANCDLEIYQEILDNRGLASEQLLTICTFTHVFNSKKHYQNKPDQHQPENQKESLMITSPFIQTEMELKPKF